MAAFDFKGLASSITQTPQSQSHTMANQNTRRQGWCWTLNNPTDEEAAEVDALQQAATYTIFGKEKGDSGTFHLQGYVFFPTKKSFTQVKAMLPRAHWEGQRGTTDQAADYCKKEGDYMEFGNPPMSKKRKGEIGREFWEDILEKAKRGKFDEIDPKVQITHYRSLKAIASDHRTMPADLDCHDNLWYWGDTGTGKSRTARTENPGAYLKMCNKWWDDYQGEETVLIEDFDKAHHVLGHHLKIWADRYAFPAEVKGGKVNLRPKKIVVTSNYPPDEVWAHEPGTLGPILRRFKVVHFECPFGQ